MKALVMLVASTAVSIAACATRPAVETPAPAVGVQTLAWLSGSWVSDSPEERLEELWTEPKAGRLLGVNRRLRDGRTVHFEHLRIEARAGGVVYVATPSDQQTAEFRLVSSEPSGTAVFENFQREDFPQRIVYRREGDMLHARAEGPGGRVAEWHWRRQGSGVKAVRHRPAPELFEAGLTFGDEWQKGDAATLGLDANGLEVVLRQAEKTKTDSLLVMKDGKVVLERYFGKPPGAIETMSMTKSIVSILVGMMIAEGKIESLDAPLSTWLKGWNKGRKAKVTLRHVLTHTSGLAHQQGAGVLNKQHDRFAYARDSEVLEDPGAQFSYNNEAVQLLSGVAEAATGQPLDAYAKERLFEPLGITDFEWKKDDAGNVQTFYGLVLSARDLARIGQLLLQEGRWKGRRLVPASWIAESTTAAAKTPYHGLLWWIRRGRGHIEVSNDKLDELAVRGLELHQALRPLEGRRFFSFAASWLEVGSLLGSAARQRLAALALDQLTPFTQEPGPVIGYAADGWLGQQLIVLPAHRVVAVRQHRAPQDGSADADYNQKYGFFDFIKLLERALPTSPSR